MRTVRVQGVCLVGTEASLVTVEARFEPTDRRTEVVLSGLPDPVIRESRGRLLAALDENQLHVPQGRLTLNLVPAGVKKRGEALDLPLALGAATACGHLDPRDLSGTLFLGELGIDGRLHSVPGGLAAALAAQAAGLRQLVAPPATAREAALLPGTRALGAQSLAEVVGWSASGEGLVRAMPPRPAAGNRTADPGGGLDAVHGQTAAKRTLAVAAAGGHGLLLVGPPGTGKSMLARGLRRLLPTPNLEERLGITRVRSVLRPVEGLELERPFRAPHHTTSHVGLVGGGSPPGPGEITLAHGGVLFLDELPEFPRAALEALREPLESGSVHLARAARRIKLPARFRLVAAMNPCPCGYRGHPRRACRCSPAEVARYRRRISGPLLDRLELRMEVPVPTLAELEAPPEPEHGETQLALQVTRAVERARERQGETPNATLDGEALATHVQLNGAARDLLARAAERRALSARAITGLRRVARTLADLEGRPGVEEQHVAGALGLRAPLE